MARLKTFPAIFVCGPFRAIVGTKLAGGKMKSDPFVLLLISLYTYLIPVGVYVYILYVFDIIHQAWSKLLT